MGSIKEGNAERLRLELNNGEKNEKKEMDSKGNRQTGDCPGPPSYISFVGVAVHLLIRLDLFFRAFPRLASAATTTTTTVAPTNNIARCSVLLSDESNAFSFFLSFLFLLLV